MKPQPDEDYSIEVSPVRKENLPRRYRDAHRPPTSQIARLLTATQAFEEFPGLYYQKLYSLVARGLVHPVQPNGRILYPEWELAAALRAAIAAALEYQRLVDTAA